MNLSDQIIQNNDCIRYAKIKGGEDYLNHYNQAWLKIREKELKGYVFVVNCVPAYFKKVFDRVILDQHKKTNKITLVEDFKNDKASSVNPFYKFENWLKQKPKDEFDTFQKNIIELVSKTESKTEAINMTTLSRAKFYEHLKIAKKRLIDECT